MKILVCIRQGLDGEINPFDACAYEAALSIDGAEVTIISMGPESAKDFLFSLTRLGAKEAILLSDKAFAGADTLATAYTLSKAVEKLNPDLIFCGRQTLVGDTAQTGPMLSVLAGYNLITNVMSIDKITEKIVCTTRDEGIIEADLPALITIERINTLRLPRLRSKPTTVSVWGIEDTQANPELCGLKGSPTRVLKTFENESGRRKCKFIPLEELDSAIKEGLRKNEQKTLVKADCEKINDVFIVGEAPRGFAETISDDITVLSLSDAESLAKAIKEKKPNAVIWGSDSKSKRLSAQVAAKLGLGLCADCTRLETESGELIMYRPALSGSIIAKIKSLTRPAMATVRTADNGIKDIIVGAGFGAKDCLQEIKTFAESINADFAVTRKLVDNGFASYQNQVGLTGKTVSPPVYIAVGISGAVHHIVGMERAGTVIAINNDKNAPIFDYADYGILADVEEL